MNSFSLPMKRDGVAALSLVLVLGIAAVVIITGSVFAVVRQVRQERSVLRASQALAVAEAGAEEVALRIRRGETVPSPLLLDLGGGTATVTNMTVGSIVTITSRGDVENVSRAVELKLRKSTTDASFIYGVQVGDGGIELENNASIVGSVFSDGSILGAPGASVTGDAIVAKNTPVAEDQVWTSFTDAYTFGQSDPVIDVAQRFVLSRSDVIDSVHLLLQKVGNPGNVTVLIVTDVGGTPSTTVKQRVTLPASSVSTTLSWVQVDMGSSTFYASSVPYWIVLDVSRNASNYYRWGSDTGNGYARGIGMYSSRCCSGNPTWESAGRDFNFKVWIGGDTHTIGDVDVGAGASAPTLSGTSVTGDVAASGTVDGVTVGGNVNANAISNCTIAGNAAYNTKTNCTVGGTETTPTTPPEDSDPIGLPIPDQAIADWKNDAAAGGTWTGDCIPGDPDNGCPLTLGPLHITGSLLLTRNNITVTIAGTVWVDGNIDISNGSRMVLDPGYGELSGVVVADGWIHIANNGQFQGSGQPGSYVMLLTTLACTGLTEETGCTHHQAALDIHNNATGVIFYAQRGMIFLHQQVTVTEITGWKFHHENNSTVIYEQGLANAKFSSGPAGGYTTISWREIVPP